MLLKRSLTAYISLTLLGSVLVVVSSSSPAQAAALGTVSINCSSVSIEGSTIVATGGVGDTFVITNVAGGTGAHNCLIADTPRLTGDEGGIVVAPGATSGAITIADYGTFTISSSLPATPTTAIAGSARTFEISGAVTIVSSGGALLNSGWTYNAGVLEVPSTPSIKINASDIVSRLDQDLIVRAPNIIVDADINSPTASDLILQAVGKIVVNGGSDVVTQGGDIIFQSNRTNAADSALGSIDGSIRLGLSTDNSTGLIDSNGGNITFGGGSNLATGYAMGFADHSLADTGGVVGYGFNVQADGGSILVRGKTTVGSGGSTTNPRAVIFGRNATTDATLARQKLQTSGSGTITIVGDGGTTRTTFVGVISTGLDILSASGAIAISGSKTGGARGVSMTNFSITSTSGNISIDETTNRTVVTRAGGMLLGGTVNLSTSGNILIRADEFSNTSALTLTSPSAVIKSYTSSSFVTSPTVTGYMDLSNCQSFSFGQEGNTGAITISQPLSSGGPMSFYGGGIAIGGALTATGSSITLYSSGAVTQTQPIVSSQLGLAGSGTYTLTNASNNIGVLAGGSSGSRLGAVSVTDLTGGLTIGQVGSLTGLYSSGVIDVSTTSGNLTVNQPVSSTATSTDSVLLYADKDAASGAAGDGNIIISGSGAISNAASARALLYSGVRGSSTGLVDLVGGEVNTRSLVAATTALNTISPALGATGQFALFRTNTPMPYSVTYDANGATGGSVPVSTTHDSGATVTLSGNSGTLARTGYTWGGWTTTVNTGSAVTTVTMSGNLTVYAKWDAVVSGGGGGAESTPVVQPTVTTPAPARIPRVIPVTPPNAATPTPAPTPAPTPPPPSLPGLRSFFGQSTIDLGVPAQQSAGGAQATQATEVSSNSAGRRTVDELAQESLGGFQPGATTTIEILGARTAARFVVSDATELDSFTLIRAIEASLPTQAADFFAIDSVLPVNQPTVPRAWTPDERGEVVEFFAAVGLAAPASLADLNLDDYSQWLLVTANSSTYAPGTQVYLTLTSDPLVLASAVVGQDGTVNLSGTLPVEFLSLGEHRLRLVGIRALDGVSVDDEGEIKLTPELLREIERFDLGTQATIAVVGPNEQGAIHIAMRVIPLVPIAPWWTLWIILVGALVAWALRLAPVRTIRIRRLSNVVIGVVALLPAVILGWLSTVTMVAWWGLGLGLASVMLSALGPYRKARGQERANSRRF